MIVFAFCMVHKIFPISAQLKCKREIWWFGIFPISLRWERIMGHVYLARLLGVTLFTLLYINISSTQNTQGLVAYCWPLSSQTCHTRGLYWLNIATLQIMDSECFEQSVLHLYHATKWHYYQILLRHRPLCHNWFRQRTARMQ